MNGEEKAVFRFSFSAFRSASYHAFTAAFFAWRRFLRAFAPLIFVFFHFHFRYATIEARDSYSSFILSFSFFLTVHSSIFLLRHFMFLFADVLSSSFLLFFHFRTVFARLLQTFSPIFSDFRYSLHLFIFASGFLCLFASSTAFTFTPFQAGTGSTRFFCSSPYCLALFYSTALSYVNSFRQFPR